MSFEQAAWKPSPRRRCIREHVLHAAYWKYVVRRRLLGEKRGSFPLAGSNWFPVPRNPSPALWREHVALFEEQHRRLREAVASLNGRRWGAVPAGGTLTAGFLIRGVAFHDIYHAGQIQLLKRLQRS